MARNKRISRIADEDFAHIWKGVPLFDPSKVRKSHWLIESFLPEGCIQIVYGPPGVFKSTALLKAAKAVSEGEDFFGMKTRQRVVLYLDYENPSDVLKARNGDLGLGIPSSTFTIWDRFHGKPTPRPGDPVLEDFVSRCKEQTGKWPWLIFDSWTSLLKWGEGGETTGQVAPIYEAIRALRDRGVTCTVIDHTRKYRPGVIYGSEAKLSLIDLSHNFVIHKASRKLERHSSSTIVRVRADLKRYTPKGLGDFSFEIKGEQDEKGRWHIASVEPVKDPIVAKQEQHIAILRKLIHDNPGLGQRALAKLVAATTEIKRDRAEKLLHDGIDRYWKAVSAGSRKVVYKLLPSKHS
jgi:AAA domain